MSKNNKEIIELNSEIMANAMTTLLDTGQVDPKAYWGTKHKLQKVDLIVPNNPLGKAQLVNEIRHIVNETDVEYVFFLSESWLSNNTAQQPSLDPNRKEAITLICESQRHSLVTIQEFKRAGDGRITLGKIYTTDSSPLGIFSGFFNRPENTLEANI